MVGLTARQISGLRWTDAQADVAPFDGLVSARVRQVMEGRREIREAPDDVSREIQEAKFRAIEGIVEEVRLLDDATLAAFLGPDKPKVREMARKKLGAAASLAPDKSWSAIRTAAAELAGGSHPVFPFHWQTEFPEVFSGPDGGFDAIVGNPPFLGGKRISHELSDFMRNGSKCRKIVYRRISSGLGLHIRRRDGGEGQGKHPCRDAPAYR